MAIDLFRTIDIRNRRAFNLTSRDGKEYRRRLIAEVQTTEQLLLNVLPSKYISTIGSTNYGIALKAYAIEFAKLKLAIDDIGADGYYATEAYSSQRADILYQNLGSLCAVNRELNLTNFSSSEFHTFLLALIEIFFGGSTPENIKNGIETFVGEKDVATILENFLDARQPTSAFDISDQFGFRVDFLLTPHISANFTDIGIKLDFLIRLIKPAHTLYMLRFIFTELVDFISNADDSFQHPSAWDHAYDDARKYCDGVDGRDRLGHNTVIDVDHEDYSGIAGDTISTTKGPLSKSQTIPELASVSDVTVYVNSVAVAIDSIVASMGTIVLSAPVLATDIVEVSYSYWRRAEFQMVLNDPGIVLADPNFSVGRFQSYWVLNEVVPKAPQQVVWHWGGYEREYTASLNDPSTLLLNEPNHIIHDPVTGRGYNNKMVLNWANYLTSYEQSHPEDHLHYLNENTPIVELKRQADPIFEYDEIFEVPEPQGWGEIAWGDNPLGWGSPFLTFSYNFPYPVWVILDPGGPYVAPIDISKDITGEEGLLSIACEGEVETTFERFQDTFNFPTFCGENLFIFNQSLMNSMDVLGPAANACLVKGAMVETVATDVSDYPSTATDSFESIEVTGTEAYSDIFDFSGFFIFNQSNINDPTKVLHDATQQGHWFDEGYITAQLGAGPITTLSPYEKDFV